MLVTQAFFKEMENHYGKRTRGSYSTDAIAITEKSEDPERAALVLDYMKGDVNLNRLLLGGIIGCGAGVAVGAAGTDVGARVVFGVGCGVWSGVGVLSGVGVGVSSRASFITTVCISPVGRTVKSILSATL